MQAAALLGAGRIVLRNSGVRTLAPGVRTFAVDAPVVEERLAAVLASMNKAPAGALPAGSFVELGFSPLDIAEVIVAVEDEFALDIPAKESNGFKDFAGVVSFVAGAAKAK
jgi:acyl carrier protein